MRFGELELAGGGLAGAVGALWRETSVSKSSLVYYQPSRGSGTHSESACAPWGATTDFIKVGQRLERSLVPQRHIDDAVMRERTHRRDGGALLPSALGSGGDEKTAVFAPVGAGLPLLTRLVPEGLPLGGEVAVAGGDAEEKGVVLFELVGRDEGDGFVLAWGVHLAEDLLGESLFDSTRGVVSAGFIMAGMDVPGRLAPFAGPWSGVVLREDLLVEIDFASSGLNPLFLGLGDLGDVAIHGILYRLSQS